MKKSPSPHHNDFAKIIIAKPVEERNLPFSTHPNAFKEHRIKISLDI